MNKHEARTILNAELSFFRAKSYEELARLVNSQPYVAEVRTETGKRYRMEIETRWEEEAGGDVCIAGSISGSGWHSFFPLKACFVKKTSGESTGG